MTGRILLDNSGRAGGSSQLNVGSAGNDGTGDQARTGGLKLKMWATDINSMTTELYSTVPGSVQDNATDDYAALNTYLTAVGSARVNIIISGTMVLNSNVTIPANVSLQFVGAGKLKRAAAAVITINGPINAPPWQVFDNSAGGAGKFTGTPKNDFVYDEWFGALADNSTDCTAAFNASAAFAHGAGDIPRHQLGGIYRLTGITYGIGTSTASATAPSIIGVGKRLTTWSYASVSVALKFVGGSGFSQACEIRNIGFIGDTNSIGIEFAGVCGYKATRCFFDANLIGVRFHNEASGHFTENCILDGCEFRSNCITDMTFKVTSGNSSFNGSGWYNRCLVNASGTGPSIDVGAGCNVYHTSLDAHVWMTSQTGATLTFAGSFNGLGREVSGTLASNWTGTTGQYSVKFSSGEVRQVTLTNTATTATWLNPLTASATTAAAINNALINSAATGPFASFKTSDLCIETTSGNQITLAQGKNVYFSGPDIRINGLTTATGANVTAGTALRCDTVGIHADSSISFTGAKQCQRVAMSSGATTIESNLRQVRRSVDIIITASNYDYRYDVKVDYDSTGGAGFVATVDTLRTFNNGGTTNYGAPVFTVDTSGRLVITAPTQAITFTGAFSGAESSGTLTGNWNRSTGVYNVLFSNSDIRAVTLTNGATTATWSTDAVLSAAATTSATVSNYQTTGFNAYISEMQTSNGLQGSGHIQF